MRTGVEANHFSLKELPSEKKVKIALTFIGQKTINLQKISLQRRLSPRKSFQSASSNEV